MKNLIKTTLIAMFSIFLAVSSASALNSDCVNRWFTVYNKSSYNVYELYISCVDCTKWSHNYIESIGVLEPGWQVDVDGDWAPGSGSGYHVFDVYAISSDGLYWKTRLDLCTQSSWTLLD